MAAPRGWVVAVASACLVLAGFAYTSWGVHSPRWEASVPGDMGKEARPAADVPLPGHAVRELVGAPTPSAIPSTVSMVFLSTRDASVMRGLRVRLKGESPVTLERETDAAGSIQVPEGRWILSTTADRHVIRQPEVNAEADRQLVVWVSTVESLSVRIQSVSGQPIALACVTLQPEAAATEPVRAQADSDGVVVFHDIVSDGEDWLIAAKAGWLPSQRHVASLPMEGEHRIMVLSPDLEGQSIRLECLDDDGGPLAGVDVQLRPQRYGDREIWLGRSSAEGSVDVGSLMSVLPCEIWFRGPVYTTRLRLAESPPTGVLRVHLPRSVRGTLLLTGGSREDRVEIVVTDAGLTASPPALQYVNATGRWITAADGHVRTELPRNRKVCVTCRDASGRSNTQSFTAREEGWQLTATLDDPDRSHLVTLMPRGGAIGSVASGGSPVHLWRSGDVVSFRAPVGFLHLEVRGERGTAGLSLSGYLRQDTVLDVPLPELQLVPYSVRDSVGTPLCDVAVEFRRVSHLTRDAVAGTSFKSFQIPNTLVGAVDASGNGKVELLRGDYEVWLRNPSFRDRTVAWRPTQGAKLVAPTDGPLVIVAAKPRRVVIRLVGVGVEPSLRWRIHDTRGDILAVCQGSAGILWCSTDEQEISVRSEAGELLATALIPEGARECIVAPLSGHRSGR